MKNGISALIVHTVLREVKGVKNRYFKVGVRVFLTGALFFLCFLWGKQEVLRHAHVTLPTYILDAGHGGEDGGAISCTGEKESTLNLEITMRLEQILVLLGEEPLLLRNSDTSLHDEGCKTIREKKISDLKNRTKSVNSNPLSTLISIHQNSYTDQQYRGTQIFYAQTVGSKELAEEMQNIIRFSLQPENTRQAKSISENVYLLNHINNRAVLVECGFLSNPEDNRLLQQSDYQCKLVLTLAAALTRAKE